QTIPPVSNTPTSTPTSTKYSVTRMTSKKPHKSGGKEDEPVFFQTKLGSAKEIGGGESDKWNFRQMRLLLSALPGVTNADKKAAGGIGFARGEGAVRFE